MEKEEEEGEYREEDREEEEDRGKGVVTDLFKMGAKQLPQFLKQGGRMLLRKGIKKVFKEELKN